ncbi:vancomycin resistance protein VanJ [Streptomyces sp. PvR006]|uniref:endonuclease/exonuclease/phosphatase family protein n=1 Tax=Streptomyces sp. PvR006 TaxID=2817860 RepID=UPI001AE8DE3A|nr:endonuclease/exonuclease/phosphatase family protein [Streptomyces sp. PvR006]MBP2586710.1 vancomycin resistance protein VanJ [Streptomyces sp. PvR006]
MTATTRPDPAAAAHGTAAQTLPSPAPDGTADGTAGDPDRAPGASAGAAGGTDRAPETSAGAADAGSRRRWWRRRGAAVTGCSVLLAVSVAGHGLLPDLPGRLSSLAETLLPWSALAVPVLVAAALLRRAPVAAAVALVVPAAAWLAAFGGALADKTSPGGDLTLVSHNVNQANPDPGGTVRSLLAAGADVLALEELSPATAPAYEQALAKTYPYHFYQGTVGLWSVHPLSDARAVPIMPWTRAMRATVDAPGGPLAVYVAHLPSVRVGPGGFTAGARDEALGLLVAEVRAEPVRRVVVLGDLNGSTDDRALRPLTDRLVSAQVAAGAGLGFTWPARLPVVRIDQILLGGVRAASAWTLPATASDHLPVAARIHLPPDPAP